MLCRVALEFWGCHYSHVSDAEWQPPRKNTSRRRPPPRSNWFAYNYLARKLSFAAATRLGLPYWKQHLMEARWLETEWGPASHGVGGGGEKQSLGNRVPRTVGFLPGTSSQGIRSPCTRHWQGAKEEVRARIWNINKKRVEMGVMLRHKIWVSSTWAETSLSGQLLPNKSQVPSLHCLLATLSAQTCQLLVGVRNWSPLQLIDFHCMGHIHHPGKKKKNNVFYVLESAEKPVIHRAPTRRETATK